MWKKLLLLMLAAVVMLTACGGKSDAERMDHGQDPAKESEAVSKDEEGEPDVEEDSSEAFQAERLQSEEQEAAQEQEETISEFSKGTVSENGWESQWLNMRFTEPEGTRMVSQEELDTLMGISEELLSEDLSDAQIQYSELTSVREMMCYDEETQANVIVSVDWLPMKISEETYMEEIERTLSSISAMTYTRVDEDEVVEIAGASYFRSGYRVEAMGQSRYADYYVRMIDSRAVSLIVTYGEDGEEIAASMLSSFAAY